MKRLPLTPLSMVTLATLLLSLGERATAAEYRIDSAQTVVSFEVRYLGFARERGEFNNATGTVELDAQSGGGLVDIVIDARSLQAGNAAKARFLRSEGLLDVERHPQIAYRAQRVAFDSGEPRRIEGELTLLGVTKAVPLTVTHYHCGDDALPSSERCVINATATFRRSAFGMNGYRALSGDEVKLAIEAQGVRLAAEI